MSDANDKPASSLDAEGLTWAVLLGRWTDFARSSVALPKDAEGLRLRASVADLIGLQAVWFALTHLGSLDPGELALGLSRAAVLIDRHESALRKRFGEAGLPQQAEELVADARSALSDAAGLSGGDAAYE